MNKARLIINSKVNQLDLDKVLWSIQSSRKQAYESLRFQLGHQQAAKTRLVGLKDRATGDETDEVEGSIHFLTSRIAETEEALEILDVTIRTPAWYGHGMAKIGRMIKSLDHRPRPNEDISLTLDEEMDDTL